jgi:hypothetical protein
VDYTLTNEQVSVYLQKIVAAAAAACFQELQAHIFVGGKAGIVGSNSGGHLASHVLLLSPDKVGKIDVSTLIMDAHVSVHRLSSTDVLLADVTFHSMLQRRCGWMMV